MTDLTHTLAAQIEAHPCSVQVIRDMDVPKGAWPWIDGIAAECTGPHLRIETPNDAEAIVFWHDERPAAVVLNLRDQFNHSVQFRIDLRPAIVTALRQAEAAPGVAEALRVELQAREEQILELGGMADSMETECGNLRKALARQHGAREQWQPIDNAPYCTTVEVRAGHMTFEASLQPGVSENDCGESVDQWQAAHEGEHPPCWSEGACWESNVDEIASLQPTAWRYLPAAPATDVGEG